MNEDRDNWLAVVNTLMNLWEFIKFGGFFG